MKANSVAWHRNQIDKQKHFLGNCQNFVREIQDRCQILREIPTEQVQCELEQGIGLLVQAHMKNIQQDTQRYERELQQAEQKGQDQFTRQVRAVA